MKVRVRDLRKEFHVRAAGREQTVRALDSISFEVGAGEFIVLTGRSGCGKTTALRLIMGLEQATSGSVEIDGRIVNGCGFDRGMVFQHAELLPWRTALGNVEFALEVKGIPAAERRAIALHSLELVGLKSAADRRPDQLSGGMRQRVGLARALAIDPQVLLMDEPFGALDAQTRESLQAELVALHQKTRKTVIFVTHDLDEAVLLADRVVVLSPHGRLHEIVDVPIPRPRNDPVAVRGTPRFQEVRYHIWSILKKTDDAMRPVAA